MKKHILWLLALLWSVTAVGETITVARALEICGGLAAGASTTQSYTIEGYVNEITNNSFNTTYNNMTFWIADTQGSLSSNAEGALYVYRGRPTVELQKGDRISITDYLKNYNGTIETANTNAPVTLLERPADREITYGSLRVCAQNLENFYLHPNTGRGNYSTDEIAAKTQKIVSMMLTVDADIYAFCEVEAKPEVLDYLVSVANSYVSGNPYVAVSDGIDEDWDATYNNNIKSGFIYRSDRVQPIGNNVAASTANYYRNTMRYQAFSQLSNGEKLVVCMNHFKAKDSSEDQGESIRMGNAYSLMNALSYVTTDPDILILGDLNCEYGEAPITYITNAGYAEQLLRFNDASIYSHCYSGGELIDHVLANNSMANQIVDAYVRHLSTTCSVGITEETSYSDHDPYVVEINLSSGATPASTMTCAAAAEAALSVSANNELYNNGEIFSIRGFVTSIATAYNPTYGNISFWMADTQNGGNVLQAYRCGVDATSIPNVNDYVEVTGQLTKYNATPEFAAGSTCQIIYNSGSAINLGPKTIAEFLQLKNTKDTCVLTGVVKNIQNTVFGNFYLEDATGSLYIYGLLTPEGAAQKFDSLGIAEGDTLTLKATYLEYNQSPQAKNAIYVSHSKQATFWGPVTVKLDPSSTTMYSWNQVGIWAWVTNGTKSTDLFEQWPGVPVTIDPETGWWSYTFNSIPSGQLNIIWNDYGYYGYQTDDIENVAENTCYRLPSYSYLHEVVDCPTTHDTIFLYSVANYIDFQALYDANPSIADTIVTSYQYVTLPNGSQVCGFMKTDGTEANNTWNVKAGYNTLRPTPEWDGVEALVSGTEFRAASGSSIRLGAFTMENAGKLTVYFSPNGDSERGVSIAVKGDTVTYRKSGVKIGNPRPAYAVDVNLPAGYYAKGDIVITVVTNTTNILGVGIHPDPIIGEREMDLTVAEAITLGNQLGNNTLSEDSVSVIGYVVSASDFDMAFGNQSFYIADAPNGEQTMQAYRAIPMKDGALYPVLVGDLVRIKGKLQHYVNSNTSEDFVELYQPTVSFLTEVDGDRSLPAVPVISVTQALQYGNELSVGYRTRTFYDIVGYVTNIVEDAVSTYGNMTFWISDTQNGAASNAEGGFYVYRGATGKSLQVGDLVRVRTYIRNTSVLIDNSNVIASAASVPVTFLCQSMSNVNITKVWPIILDNTTYSAWNGKIQYDFRQNDENCFFYNWENTYSSISSGSGLNFYGNYDGYWRFVVGTQYWAGGGLYLGNNPALTAEALRQAIVAHPEKYYLHMAVKATDNYTHAFYVFNSEAAAFELGEHSAYGHEVRQNFTRNGEWQEIYVPLSDYVTAIASMDMSANSNLFVILSEGVQGAQIDLDAVFICEIGEGTPQPEGTPTEADLVAAGYDTTNNIVLAFKFDVAPCYDVVIAGTYMMNGDSWITDPEQLVHMTPLTGFDGWYAAQIPFANDNDQAKPVQLSDLGAFNWDFQAGDSWTYKGGNYPYVEQGYSGEVNVYYYSPGAYIYEIGYWKNHNNPCTSLTTTYDVYLNAPANAPASVEMIGSFDGWTGTTMTYDSLLGMWHVRIQAVPTDEFKFRTGIGADDNTKWNYQIQAYDAENDTWSDLPNLLISQHLSSENVVYVDYSNDNLYRWTLQPEQPGEWFIDWNNLPEGYVFEAVRPQDAAYQALKSVKVYADTTYIHMLIEPDLNELPDLSWVPLDIYLNTDNSDNTGGNNTIFIDAYADVLLEGGVFVDGEFAAYDPYGYKWWGAAGEIDWNYWVDPNTNHDDSDCWGALVCEGQWNGAISSQYINGKIEMKLLRSAIPATWNKTQFGIGFNLMSTSWETYGVLPIGSPTDENPNGLTNMMTVRMYGASEEPTSTYYVYLNAPENAPASIEVIGTFDNWIGTAMTNQGGGLWSATIQAYATDQFKFRQAGTWDNEIQVYDGSSDSWMNLGNLPITYYLINDSTIYVDFSSTSQYRWKVPVTAEPIQLTISSITSEFYTEDNDIWYRLSMADGDNYFTVDIIVPDGMQDVELGHVYTWSDMLQRYCGGQYNGASVTYTDAQFVKTQVTGGVQISVLITATSGQQYMLTYTGADVSPFDYDAETAYSENFPDYSSAVNGTNKILVSATQDDDATLRIEFNVPEGCDTLAAGTYTINATGNPMTVKASEGFVSGITTSWAGYYDGNGYIDIPVWYLVSGTVTVAADGTINVNALNSKGYAVQSQLTKAQVQPSDAPTVADLENAGYDTDNNIVLAYKFDVAPCYDVVIAGTYMMDSAGNWITDPSQLVHMMPLAGFNGWYAAQIPYTEYSVQAKPVQLSDIGAFNWDNQAGDVNAWIHRGGNEAYIVSGYDNEVNVYYESPGAYIYEIAYWKNHNNPCTSQTTTYTVFLEAPQNAPDSIEIIGSFDNWMGTLMTYDAQTGYWTATITATPSDVFKFRQAGNWGNEILVYNSEYDDWTTLPNLVISQYLHDNIVYLDFDNAELYRWTKQDDESTYYIPYNLQAVSVPGRVEFSWDVDVVSDQYKLHIYDVNSTAAYFLTIYGTSTYVYAVEDFLDGMEFRWSVEPISPYDLDEVFADSTIVMHKSEVELSGFNLTTVDSITLDLTWQSNKENLLYRVEVDYNGSIIREETVNLKEYHFTSKLPGWHQVYVQPLNADGEAVGRYTYAGEINLARVPEPFSNLQGAANEHELTFTWNKVVDSVYVQIFRMVDGEFSDYIYHAPTAGNSMVYTVNEDGNYALQLRAYLEIRPGQYGTVDYAKYITVQAFSVPTYSIQIDAAEGGYIWPDLSGEYPLGYTLKAYAYPYEGYRFVGWNDGNTDQERTITVQGAMSITALFEALDSYTVTVQASEGGHVYVSYLGDYTTLYSETLYEGTYIQLQARPVDGYAFYQWSDGVTDAIRYITVNADVNLTAIFMPYRHLTVAVNDASMGKVTVTGDYDFADGVYTAAHGAALTLIAQPNEGYHFAGWSDGVQTVQRIVNMTEDKSLTAIFAVNTAPVVQYNITVSATDGGSVNDVSGTYNSGDMIELIATPMEGYEFVQWSDGVSTNPRTLTVTGNKSLTAIFRIRTISISVTAGPGGTVNGTVSGFYNYGTSVSFSAVPAEHYRFTGWSDGNTDIERSITLVKDTVITASFVAIPLYTLNLTAGQGGQIRVNNEPYTTTFNRAYEENTSVVIEAAANANYIFSRWSDGNTHAIRVVPMNSDLSLTAEFLPIYTLTIIANNGSVLVQGDAEATANNVYKAVAGTVLTLTAQPAEGYRFVSWSDGVQTISRDITLTSTTFLVATFEVASTTPQYTVTVGITGTGTGTVNGQTSISTLYYENDQVPLTALAGESSEFVGWSDGVTTASRTLVVSSDTLVIAIFNFVEPTVQYTVTFKNYDGTILESKKWNEGETPTCSVMPTHPDDEANTYSFIGWTPEIVPVTADAVYTAVFEATPVVLPSFTVTFYDWDDSVLSQQSVTKGENATPPETPTRAGYVFTGWDGNYTNVQHDEAVFATYKPAEEALEDVLEGNNAVKIFREGQIFILRGDKTYTLDGQIVR